MSNFVIPSFNDIQLLWISKYSPMHDRTCISLSLSRWFTAGMNEGKRKGKKRQKNEKSGPAYTWMTRGATAAEKKEKKKAGPSRSYRRPTFLPFGRVPGALSRLLFSPFPCYYRPYLRLPVSFLCHAITCRELARTLRIPRTCLSRVFSFNLAAEKSLDSPSPSPPPSLFFLGILPSIPSLSIRF